MGWALSPDLSGSSLSVYRQVLSRVPGMYSSRNKYHFDVLSTMSAFTISTSNIRKRKHEVYKDYNNGHEARTRNFSESAGRMHANQIVGLVIVSLHHAYTTCSGDCEAKH
jgi:hypothetical protein